MTTLRLDSTFVPGARTRRPDAALATRPLAEGFDGEYWLRHCEGYRVDAVEGRIGFVDSIEEHADDGVVLVVRAGLLGQRLVSVRARDVAFVVPRAERIWLASSARIVESEWFSAAKIGPTPRRTREPRGIRDVEPTAPTA
jgi:hypothetical protein